MKKMFLALCLLWSGCLLATAQVVGLQEIPFATLGVEQRQDLNGDVCAVVMLETEDGQMQFEGNLIGKPLFKEGIMYVYLTEGTKQLKVIPSKSSSFMVYFNKYSVKSLRSNVGYVLKLQSKANDEIGELQLDASFKPYKVVKLEETMSFGELEKLADKGNVDAQAAVAKCYLKGIGVEKNAQKFLHYVQKAVAKGNAIAQNLMGVAYEVGFSVKKDSQKAARWYQMAAQQNYPIAICNLGDMYDNGDGLAKNPQQALALFQQALALGWADACFDLYLHYSEEGIEPNSQKAIEYLKQGVRYGSSQCQAQLGVCYANGIGGIAQKDYIKAFQLYQMSAEQNDVDGMALLGVCYYYGQGTKKDYSKAFYWLRMAAENNDAQAQYLIGCCYLDGTGVTPSRKEAKVWLQKAVDNNVEEAKEVLQEIQ